MRPQLRPMREDDKSFIINSYLKTMRYRHPFAEMTDDVYFPPQRKELNTILAAGDVIVACNPEDSQHLYGYIVSEKFASGTVVHFIYVKHALRKFGIARELFCQAIGKQETTLVTHVTQSNFKRLATKYSLIYDPYLLRGLQCS